MAFQKINDNLYLNQALVVSCGVMQKGSKNVYTLKLNSGVDVNLTDICPNNEMAEAIYNQVKAWEGGGGGGPVGPLEDLMYDDEHTLSEVMDTKLEGDVKDLVYDSETGDTVGETLAEMQEDIDAPLKDKEYGTVTETITVEDEFVDGQTYSIVKDIPFTEEELALLDSLDNGTEFYFEPDPEFPENLKSRIAWQTTDGSYISFSRNDDNIPESYYPDGQGWYVESEGIDKYDEYVETYGEAPSFTIYTEYINSQYEGLLKKIFGLSSHTETITRTLTLEEKFDNVPQGLAKNFIYDKISGEGGIQPVFDMQTVIQENQALFTEVFGSIEERTMIYGQEGDEEYRWTCAYMMQDAPCFIWIKEIDGIRDIYTFNLSSGWSYISFDPSQGPSPSVEITSQDDLPIIDDYDESLIQERFEEIIPLIITGSQEGDVAINLEQKFNEPLKNKVYEISTISAFYDVPKWSEINVTDTAVVYSGLGTVVRVMIANPGDYGVFVEIRAVGSTSSYRIQSFSGYGDEADTWYPEKPVIQYNESAVNPKFEDIWKAIYQTPGAVTLEEKLNSIGGSGEDEELKNKTYGTEVTVLSTPVLVDMPVTTEVQPKVGGVLPDVEGLPSSQSENQLPIYFDDQVLITYYYRRQSSTSGLMETFSGYMVSTVDNQMFDYQQMYNSSTRNEWSGISSQDNAPTIAGLWITTATRPVPIGYRSTVPNYSDCQYISSYNQVQNKPAMWDQAYRLFYYYDSDNDKYYPISSYDEWGTQDVYAPVFSYLDSEPEDWANVYSNGEYFDPEIPFAVIQTIFCRVQKSTLTLEQKVNQIGYSSAYITDLPTEPNLSGRLIIVLCSEEPEYKYDGYLYIVAEDADLTPYTSGAQDNSGNSGGGGSQIDPGMITPAPMPAP